MNTSEGLRPVANVIWNLFLAFIPVVMAHFLALAWRRPQWSVALRRTVFTIFFPVWAIFLPNTCYLFTEWRHYLDALTDTNVYDRALHSHFAMAHLLGLTLFYACYTGAGLLSFFLAIWPLERILRVRYPAPAWLAKAAGFPICSLGVYLGLVHRFNSWDLVHHHLLRTILDTSLQAVHNRFTCALIVAFAIFLAFLYWCFDVWMDGFRAREWGNLKKRMGH